MFQLSRVAASQRQKDAATMDKWWLSVFTALVFQTLLSCSGQPDLICSHGPITVLPGDDVILSCRLEPSIRADSVTIMWIKPGLEPKYIYVLKDGRLIYQNQNPSYRYRTRLFVDELKNGNVSMKIMKVVLSDGGKYVCIIPLIQKEASIQLIVGSVSTHITEDTEDPEFFKTPSSSSSSTNVIIGLVTGIVILIIIIVSVVFIRKLNQKKRRNQGSIKKNQSNSTNHDVLPLNDRRRNSA